MGAQAQATVCSVNGNVSGIVYPTGVIASEAKQSSSAALYLDCFVAVLLAMTRYRCGRSR